MSLTGNLGIFPLEDVLRMLSHSQKTGCLTIEAPGVHGRVFLQSGKLSLATVATDEEFRRQLLTAGLVEESQFRRVELSGAVLTEVLGGGATTAGLSEFVREHVVESLYRIRRPEAGTFDFLVDATPRYPTGQTYDVDVVLSESQRRASEWAEIESVLPDGSVPLRMVDALPDDESVTLNPQTWRILAALGSGTSTLDVARMLGMSSFWTSREMAGLARNGLVTEAAAPAVDTGDWAADEVAASLPEENEPALPQEESQFPDPSSPEPSSPEPSSPEPSSPEPSSPEPLVPETRFPEDPQIGDDTGTPASRQPTEELPVVGADDVDGEDRPAASDDTAFVESLDADSSAAVATGDAGTGEAIEESPHAWGATGDDEAADAGSDTSDEDDPPIVDSPWSRPSPESTMSAPATSEAEETTAESPWQGLGRDTPAAAPDDEPAAEEGRQASWSQWGVIEGDDTDVEQPVVEPVEEGPEPAADAGASGGWWTASAGDDEEESPQATDAEADRFLESVFSSLSDEEEASDESGEDETGFGLGLLRRRRMNAAARDIAETDS